MAATAERYVSIVIPMYDSAPFIRHTIESCLFQTYRYVHIILVDDGSTDETVRICEQFGPDVTVISQANKGRGCARNTGVMASGDEFIAFLDHDDLLERESVETRVRYLDGNPESGWVCSDAVEFDENGELRRYLNQFPWLDVNADQFIQVLRGCFPLTSSVMIRRELLNEVGGFDTRINYGDDLELFMRLFLVSRVGVIREPLVRRRIHPSQGVSSTFDRWNSRVGIYGNFMPLAGRMSPEQERALQSALKHAHYKLGEYYWECLDLRNAARNFLKSLGPYPFRSRALAYWAASQLPVGAVRTARRWKRAYCETGGNRCHRGC